MANEIRLSQCMIVKNEEKYMEQALSWGRDIVFEQIVVDTGSTDRTVEIAEKMGARVYHYQWDDDFSAAKNYAIEKAGGNWIAFLDADERFTEEDAAKIIPILQEANTDYRIDAIQCQCIHLDEDGTIIGTSLLDRFFRNDAKIRYHNRIHEELLRKGKEGLRRKDMQDKLAVLHAYGDGGKARQQAKGARNARILQKELAENSKDALRILYLADAFSMAQEEDKALATYRRILSDQSLDVVHEVVMQRAGFEVMMRLLPDSGDVSEDASGAPSGRASEEARTEFFDVVQKLKKWGGEAHPDLYYLPGCWYVLQDDYQKAAEYFEAAIGKLEAYRGMETVRLSTNLTLACCVIAKAALERKELQKAVQYAVLTLQGARYHDEAIVILLQAFREEWQKAAVGAAPSRGGAPVDGYINFLRQFYDLQKADDVEFLRNAAEKAGFDALQKAM